MPSNCRVYYPPEDPASGLVHFQVYELSSDRSPRRTAASIAARAAVVEVARAEVKSVAFQVRLEQESAVNGYSIFIALRPAMCVVFLYLQNVWDLGPMATPYDTMHLVLLNVVPHLWKLFARLKLVSNKADEEYIMLRTALVLIGRELCGTRRTVPTAQARPRRNIEIDHKSFKAVDWLHFTQCSGKTLLAGRIPNSYSTPSWQPAGLSACFLD